MGEIAPDLPPYPPEFTPEQRLTVYWFALGRDIPIRATNSWRIIFQAAEGMAKIWKANIARAKAAAQPDPNDSTTDIPPPEPHPQHNGAIVNLDGEPPW